MQNEKKVILGVTDSYGNRLPEWVYTSITDSKEKQQEAMKVNTFICIAKKLMEAGETVFYDAPKKTLHKIKEPNISLMSFELV